MKQGRKPGYRHNETTRAKIQAAQLINRLTKHVMADKPIMDSSQVKAAQVLLSKTLPDLSAVSMDATLGVTMASKEQRDAAVAAFLRAKG